MTNHKKGRRPAAHGGAAKASSARGSAGGATTRGATRANATQASSRDEKRKEFLARPNRRRMPLIVAGVAIVVMALAAAAVFVATGDDKATQVAAEPAAGVATAGPPSSGEGQSSGGGQSAGQAADAVTLSMADISTTASFYRTEVSGTEVGFFVAKAADGSLRSAFDACQVCYAQKKGYRQEGGNMICNNCGRSFPIDRVGVERGGCNPVPLTGTVVDGRLSFSSAALAAGSPLFQ